MCHCHKLQAVFIINRFIISMASTMIPLKKAISHERFLTPNSASRPSGWWAPIWRGLFVDPAGKHYRAMGRALWLYGYLIVHANRKTGVLYRRIATISNDMHVSVRTVQTWLLLLKRSDYITTKTNGRALEIRIMKWKLIQKAHQRSIHVGA
jgi:hypothetical protein